MWASMPMTLWKTVLAPTSSRIPTAAKWLDAPVALGSDRCRSLLEDLAKIADPRKRCGRRHALATVLAVAVAAVLAGARSLVAIGEWAADAPQPAWRRAVAVDGKTLRGSGHHGHAQVHLLAAMDHTSCAVLARPTSTTPPTRSPGSGPTGWAGPRRAGHHRRRTAHPSRPPRLAGHRQARRLRPDRKDQPTHPALPAGHPAVARHPSPGPHPRPRPPPRRCTHPRHHLRRGRLPDPRRHHPRAMASLRNLAAALRLRGWRNLAAALRRNARDATRVLPLLGITSP